MAIALPFIVVRITYLFLSVVQPSDLRWNDLAGPIAPYLLMGLLMEYAVVCIYLAIGFIIPVQRGKKSERGHALGGYSKGSVKPPAVKRLRDGEGNLTDC